MAKKILVCCGAGVATSTMVAVKLEEALAEKGIEVKCDHCKVMEVGGMVERYDLLVSNVQMEHDLDVPVVMGLPFITGIGKDDALQDLITKLGAE